MIPGHTAFTRIPSAAYSKADDLVSPTTACLLAEYADNCLEPTSPATEAVLTMTPPPLIQHLRYLIFKAEPYTFDVDLHQSVKGVFRILVETPGDVAFYACVVVGAVHSAISFNH